jgi:hypothetical protein
MKLLSISAGVRPYGAPDGLLSGSAVEFLNRGPHHGKPGVPEKITVLCPVCALCGEFTMY